MSKYKVTAFAPGLPTITETFKYRHFALRAAKTSLKIYTKVKIEKIIS